MARHSTREMELKEKVDADRLIQLLCQFTDGIQNQRNYTLQVKGEDCVVPIEELDSAKMEVEYEIDKNELELQFTIKWKNIDMEQLSSESRM